MDKIKLIWLVSGLAVAIAVGALFLFSQDVLNNNKEAGGPQTPPQQWPGENGGRPPRMNMSEEERQQLMEERMQMATGACQDKAEGDACTMQGPRGNMTGTCETGRDGSGLMCTGTTMRGNRSWEH